jgi:mannosyltransferase
MPSEAKQYSSKKIFWSVVGLMALVVVLSLTIFSRQSLRLDESQSLWQTSRSPAKILNIVAQDVHVPFYHIALHYWQLFLGNTVAAGRTFSLIFFLLSIPALYFLGKRAFDERTALFATILFSISPFMNWYGNEIRMYSLFTLLTILSQYFFLGIYKYKDKDSWAGYFIVGLLGIFVHYFFWFVLLVQALFYFLYKNAFPKGTLKRFVIVAVMYFAAFSPWFIYVKTLGTVSNEAPVLPIPTTVNIFNTFSQFIFGFQNDHLNTIVVSLWPLTVLFGFLALRAHKRVVPEVVYMILSILIPIIAAFLVSIAFVPLFVSRYLIMTIPALYLLIAWIFSTYPESLRKSLQVILIFLMLASLTVEIINPSAPVKEDYKDAVAYLNQNAAPQDVIILSAPFTVYPVEYYYHGPSDIQTLPLWNRFITGPIPRFDESKLPEEVDSLKANHQRAWVLLSYNQGFEDNIRLYFESNFQRLYMKQFSPGLTLYEYRLRYDVPVFKQADNL